MPVAAVYIWASLLSWLSRGLEETVSKWKPGCVMTRGLMDVIEKKFHFDKFGLKDGLMNLCWFFLMFITCLYLNKVVRQRSLQSNASSPLYGPKSSISPESPL